LRLARKSKKPKQVDGSFIGILSGYVEPGSYAYFGSSDAPVDVPSGGADCRGLVIAASTMSSTSLPNLPEAVSPANEVYLIRYFRAYPGSTTPRKVDDALYWADSNDRAWAIHSKESPDHHSTIMSSTDMAGLIGDLNLPSARCGSLDQYRIAGAYLEFEDPFIDDD
jgi:hypothetical protein